MGGETSIFAMYWEFMLIGGAFMLISWAVSSRLKNKFAKYSKVQLANGMTGKEVAEQMLRDNGIDDVQVVSVPGHLTDHYHPNKKTVNLSEAVYNESNAAAVAVAAHECGHAVQHAKAYGPLKFRSIMVPLQAASGMIMNIIVMASFFGGYVLYSAFPMESILWVIVGAQSLITAFALITLPVEFDASNRALAWINNNGVVTSEEYGMSKDALKWAAMTYVVAALSAIVSLLFWVMMLLGARD